MFCTHPALNIFLVLTPPCAIFQKLDVLAHLVGVQMRLLLQLFMCSATVWVIFMNVFGAMKEVCLMLSMCLVLLWAMFDTRP